MLTTMLELRGNVRMNVALHHLCCNVVVTTCNPIALLMYALSSLRSFFLLLLGYIVGQRIQRSLEAARVSRPQARAALGLRIRVPARKLPAGSCLSAAEVCAPGWLGAAWSALRGCIRTAGSM